MFIALISITLALSESGPYSQNSWPLAHKVSFARMTSLHPAILPTNVHVLPTSSGHVHLPQKLKGSIPVYPVSYDSRNENC